MNLGYMQYLNAIELIADKAREWKVDSVYGIPRGGLVPAVYLSHRLEVPIEWGLKTLLVDDISDSGKTLQYWTEEEDVYKTATIFYWKMSCFEPDFWVYEKEDDWVIFPWEKSLK